MALACLRLVLSILAGAAWVVADPATADAAARRGPLGLAAAYLGQVSAFGIAAALLASLLVLAILALRRRIAQRKTAEAMLRRLDDLQGETAERSDALAATQARHRDFAEIAEDWFWETDAEGRFTFLSDRFGEATEIPIEAFIGRTPEELLGVDISADMKEIREAITAQRPFSNVVQRVDFADGRRRFWRLSGKPICDPRSRAFAGYRGSGSDVTKPVESEIMLTVALSRAESADQQARRDRARLVDAINAIPAGFALWDAEDRLVLCNARYREIYASTADLIVPGVHYERLVREAAVRHGESLIDPDAMSWVTQRLAMRQLAQHSAQGAALEEQRLIGGRWIEVDERPTTDGGIVAVCIDVTEKRQREASERECEKLAALGQLAGGVAHEINNLLQPAVVLPEFVAERLPPGDIESHEDLAAILDGARKSREILKNVQRFARKEELALAPLDVIAEVKAALAFMRDLIPPSVEIRQALEPAPALRQVAANKTQLAQVITNLVVNAAQAMRDRGTITVAAASWQPTPAEAARLEIDAAASYLAISVSDTGCGMDAATQARIFEPFFTTKPVGQGTGLGLSVVYGILKSWKGGVTVASEPGHGATFTLYIPLLAAEAAPLALTGS